MTAPIPYAYGLCFPGLGDDGWFMRAEAGSWPDVHVSWELDRPGAPRLDPGEQSLDLLERSSAVGRVILDRRARTARNFLTEPVDADEFVRPYIDNCVTAFARWEGHEVFHAGAFVAHGGAWAVVGESEAGKSTLLGALAAAGCDVVADDVLVVDDERAYAGARCVDLHGDSVALLGLTDRVRPARRATVSRLPLPAMDPVVAFRGWVFLAWADRLEAARLSAADCLARVTGLRRWADAPTDPRRLLRFASLPAFELRRPRASDDVRAVAEAALAATAAHSMARRGAGKLAR